MNESSSNPKNSANRSYADVIFSTLESALQTRFERRFLAFIRRQNTTRWMIATDFCIGDVNRPNDSFAFVVMPLGDKLKRTFEDIARLPARDLKEVKKPPEPLLRLLRKGRVFTFCFVADRDRRLFLGGDAARKSIADTITMAEQWENAAECESTIQLLKSFKQEASKKSLNVSLLSDVVLTSIFASYITYLLCKYSNADRIGWAPDRDKITGGFNGIATTMYQINVASICAKDSINTPSLGIFVQDNQDLWCDPFIRVADYVAGTGAAWDPPGVDDVPEKIKLVLDGAFADNPNLAPLRLAMGYDELGQFICEIAGVDISNRPSALQRQTGKRHAGIYSLRGRSRVLKAP